MARKGDFRLLGMALLGLWSAACGGAGEGPAVEEQTGAIVTSNALTVNALTVNALTINALTINALTINALTINALTINGLRDPNARMLMKYVVSCALPADANLTIPVDGVSYSFAGGLGLAPEWGEEGGHCDESCQRWVSACVLGRVDFLGVEKPISERGANPALAASFQELRDYPAIEATYYGNIFAPGKPMFVCLPPGKKEIPRVCGPSLDNCPMEVVGSCTQACSRVNFPFAGFGDCSSSGRARRPETYHESITVFLPRLGM
jgi:hypothetical protein